MKAQEAEGHVAANPHSGLGQDRLPGALGCVPSDLRALISSFSEQTSLGTSKVRVHARHREQGLGPGWKLRLSRVLL